MQPTIASLFSEIRGWLAWAPDWATALVLVALAVISAVAVHAAALAAVRRAIPEKRAFLRRLIEGTRGPSRLALTIFMLVSVLPVAPLDATATNILQHALLIGLVLLLGWAAIAAVRIGADGYLQRFSHDAADFFLARKHTTQIRILERAAVGLIVVFTIAGILMTFEPVRQYGVSLFASAGLAGIVAGLAARPALSNLFAGLQIAIAQPIRLEDIVVVEGQWGRIEEITSTYVVVRLWDLRRLIVPLSHFIERPFENWTRNTTQLLAPVVLHLDYRAPIEAIRKKVDEIAEQSSFWDRVTKTVQVVDSTVDGIQVRVLLSARDSGDQWNLRTEVREKLITFLQEHHPEALPKQRTAVESGAKALAVAAQKASEESDD
jgi:small-conductance mechanosensitive channel